MPAAFLSLTDHACLELPVPRSLLSAKIRSYLGPELSFYNWAHDKLFGPTVPEPEQSRMVEYIDATKSHDMSRLWWDALSRWLSQPYADANKVVWQQKECINSHGYLGKDAVECEQQGIQPSMLPAVRFFGAGYLSRGQPYTGDQSAEALVDFAKRLNQVDAEDRLSSEMHDVDSPATAAAAPLLSDSSQAEAHQREDAENAQLSSEDFDYRLVSYYAAAGPRSKRFEGVVSEASDVWNEATDPDADATFVAGLRKNDEARGFGWPRGQTDPPLVWWEQRECYDKNWNPGKDYAMCQRHHVKVPSVHLYKLPRHEEALTEEDDIPNEQVDGGVLPSVEFRGPRTVNGVIDFLRRETNVDESMKNQQDFLRSLLGSDGPATTNAAASTTEQEQQHAAEVQEETDKLYKSVNAMERLQTMAPLACLAATAISLQSFPCTSSSSSSIKRQQQTSFL